jgi:hypothetical protein
MYIPAILTRNSYALPVLCENLFSLAIYDILPEYATLDSRSSQRLEYVIVLIHSENYERPLRLRAVTRAATMSAIV